TPEELLRLQNETAAQKQGQTEPQSLPQCQIVDPQSESQKNCDDQKPKTDKPENLDQTKTTTKEDAKKDVTRKNDAEEKSQEKKPEPKEHKKTNPAPSSHGTRLDDPPQSGKSINGSVKFPSKDPDGVSVTVKDGNLIKDGRRVGELVVRDGKIFVTQ